MPDDTQSTCLISVQNASFVFNDAATVHGNLVGGNCFFLYPFTNMHIQLDLHNYKTHAH